MPEFKDRPRALEPFMQTDYLQAVAWIGGIRYALGNDEMIAAFRKDTGNRWSPGRTPLERMIDEAAGADGAFFLAFAEWFTKNIWGEGCPHGYSAGCSDAECEGTPFGREVPA